MAPRPAPRSGCPALPYLALFVTTNREQAPQGTGQSSVPDDDAFPYGCFCNRTSCHRQKDRLSELIY